MQYALRTILFQAKNRKEGYLAYEIIIYYFIYIIYFFFFFGGGGGREFLIPFNGFSKSLKIGLNVPPAD